MRRNRRCVVVALLGLIVFGLSPQGPAGTKGHEIFPLAKVRRGQTGYGLTTMKGTKPERFEFEVIGVAKNMLPKMDIILVKSDDPKFAISGFWQGMSGSPLFIDDKLACAYAYGWRFNKIALGGCTPIQYMVKEGFTPPRRIYDGAGGSGTSIKGKKRPRARRVSKRSSGKQPAPLTVASIEDWLRVAPERTVDSAMATLGKPRQPWLMKAPLPHAPGRPNLVARASGKGDYGLEPASVPLAMSGFSTAALDQAKALLGPYPVEPMRVGGTGSSTEGPRSFELGSHLSVQLTRGDMSFAAFGTVSYVAGNRVLGFGHPLFQFGEFYAPVTAAEVHTILPSAVHAFVMASPLRELGSLVQDRKSTIMADTRLETRMIPMDMYIDYKDAKGKKSKGEFHVELVNNRFLTGTFAGMSAMSAIAHYLPDRDHATVRMNSSIEVRGYKPLHFVDYLYADDGVGSVIGGARGLRVLVPLLNNPFAPVDIERIELRAEIHYQVNFGKITEIRLPTVDLVPGKRSYVEVLMTTYDGSNIREKVPFDVPASLANSIVRLEVTAGDGANLDAAPPRSLDDLVAAFRKLLPGNVFAVTLYTANEGVAIDGKLIRDLPPSALDRLHPRSRTQRSDLYRPLVRSTYPSRRVINGSRAILVKVADK